MLDKAKLFTGVDLALGGETPLVTYCEDAVIFSEGDPGTLAYLIEHGEVRISKQIGGENRIIATLGPGELLGEMALIDEGGRSATATAAVESELVPISQVQLARAISSADPLLQLLMQELTHRLRKAGDNNTDTPAPGARREKARQAAFENIRVQRELRNALKRGELVLYCQPIVEIPSRRLLGFEALVRWLHPERGMVPPSEFIDIAESSGLIIPMGLWVLETACHVLKRLRSQSNHDMAKTAPLFMGVNVSPRQLRNPYDVDNLVKTLAAAELEPGAIKLEVTEQAMMQDPETAQSAMQKLRAAGAKLAIDDFGTGYSSLSYLHRFPIDVLKVDQSFVSQMLNDANIHRIMRAIIGLARDLQLDVIAEGIERPEEAEKLVDLGCVQAQGYLFSKPILVSDALRLVREQTEGQAA